MDTVYNYQKEGKITILAELKCDASRCEQFCGDVVFDSVDMASWYDDNILDQIFPDLFYEGFKFQK